MSIEISKASSHLLEGMKVESTSRGFKMILDEPIEAGGSNTGMNPVEAILCALGSCQCLITKMIASNMGIKIEDLKINLQGELDPTGYQGDTSVRPGYEAIRSTFIIKSNTSEEQIKELITQVEKFCPVGDTVSNGTNLVVDYVVEK
ncbi:OsmC family protein [Tepidibacter aestuarii]|uniref:OsmC family protein n=1 Tax=Tepidibacter aestuarii TaxID=2925782 RepID=UPI0020BE4C25|nr:OsmC family protein [Tepidibacter aestuarii]CAH2214878.1 putative redox protein [Tepidibacter aestuarii]